MVAIIEAIIEALVAIFDGMVELAIPADVASVSMVHVAIWSPIFLGIFAGVLSTLGVRRGRGRR
jgi:hypothetical protein